MFFTFFWELMSGYMSAGQISLKGKETCIWVYDGDNDTEALNDKFGYHLKLLLSFTLS